MAKLSAGEVLVGCLALIFAGSVILLVDFTMPSLRWEGTNLVETSYRPSRLTFMGFTPIFLGAIGCVLVYLRNQPDSSALVIRVLQKLTREIVESDPAVVASPKSEDEIKMTVAQSRAKLDTQFQTVLRMAKELDTIEAIQEWQRQERHRILSGDSMLTVEEKEERLAAVDDSAEREKQRLRDNVSVYGDE